MEKIGVFVNGQQIGLINHVNLPVDEITEYTSPAFKDLGNPNQYEYYMRRGNRIYLRNAYGKLSIEATELKQAIDGVKYGTKLIVDTN